MPKLHSRNPSSPVSRFSAFLFPLGLIGAIALTQRRGNPSKSKMHVINRLTHSRLGADRLTALALGFGGRRRWWHVGMSGVRAGGRHGQKPQDGLRPIRVPYMPDPEDSARPCVPTSISRSPHWAHSLDPCGQIGNSETNSG